MALVAAAFALVAIKASVFRGAIDGQQECSAKVAEEFGFVDFLYFILFFFFFFFFCLFVCPYKVIVSTKKSSDISFIKDYFYK